MNNQEGEHVINLNNGGRQLLLGGIGRVLFEGLIEHLHEALVEGLDILENEERFKGNDGLTIEKFLFVKKNIIEAWKIISIFRP